MKFLVVVSIFVAIVQAQAALPACALTCVSASLSASGGCSITDVQCLCNSQAFLAAYTTCTASSCSAADVQSASTVLRQLCAQASVTSISLSSAIRSATSSLSSSPSSPSSSSSSLQLPSSASVTSFASSLGSSATLLDSSAPGATQTSEISETPTTSSGRSKNGKYIGIGVGVGVFALSIFSLSVWVLLRRRKSSRNDLHNDQNLDRSDGGGDKVHVVTEVVEGAQVEKSGVTREVRPTHSVYELQEQDHIAELEATKRRIRELEIQQHARELQAAKQRLQELEAQQRAYEMADQQRYEMEHSQDKYAIPPSNDNTSSPHFKNRYEPRELP